MGSFGDDVGLIVFCSLVSCVAITLVTGIYYHWFFVILGLASSLSAAKTVSEW